MPNKHGYMTFSIPDGMKEQVENLAKKREISQASICKMAISKFLEVEI